MTNIWEHAGYEIDEGLKPHDGNFKVGHYQFFFLVKKDGRRMMKFCIWAPRPYIDGLTGAGSDAAADYLREQGLGAVKAQIDSGVFENKLLELDDSGHRLIPLDKMPEKKG